MAEPGAAISRRRSLLAWAGAVCAAALTGCSTYNANKGIGGQPTQAGATTSAPARSSAGSAASSGAPVLVQTSQVPVGGGTILASQRIVITQPKAGTFEAFTAVCTHQGCTVSSVSGGTINCPCHGSKFSITDGSVVNGPATSPLSHVSIAVQGTSITQA